MRLKAYILKFILSTYHMGLRLLENFLQAFEVGWVWLLEAQKVLKIMDFHSLTKSEEKGEDKITKIETWSYVEEMCFIMRCFH